MTDAPSSRLPALDGLRGLAALVVIVYHTTKIAAPALSGGATGTFRALSESPVKIAFAGTEAVLVFFALSGLVVALPALRSGFSWAGYLGGRLIRLYLPVWAALLFATVLIFLVPRDASSVTSGSWLQTANSHSVSFGSLLSEASLARASYDIDNVLWSLRWELVFSLLLPVFVLGAVLVRRFAVAAVAAAVTLSLVGRLLDIDGLVYLPVFFAGTVTASRVDDLRRWGEQRQGAFWVIAGAAAAGLLIAGWIARPVVAAGTPGGLLLWGLASAGAVGLLATAVGSRGAARALSTRVPRWLGRVSFSLYLVHVPVLATLAYAWGERSWPLVALVGIPLSLLTAEVFTRLVERPSHALARVVRQRLSGVGARRRVAHETSVR